ncbi:hypothetical protein A7R81_12995 [Pseudomonas aeruginosa]|nr:hypothetical protein A7R81_12995 [Pseudomonas aeruginosa]
MRLEVDAAAADVGGGQAQVAAGMQADVAAVAADRRAQGVQAVVGKRLAADRQVAGGAQVDAVPAVDPDRADAHAGALGGAEDVDASGLHGAEQAGVDAPLARTDVAGRVALDLAARVVDAVATDGQVELGRRLDLALAVDSRRQQGDAAIPVAQALALDLQGADGVVGVQRLQLAVGQFRTADQQAGMGRVDEAAAVHRDAVGVGQDVVGGLAEDFLRAVDRRGVAADHLVEDGAGGVAAQLRVGRQLSGELRGAGLQRIVEDQALAVDVVVEELVVRQAGGVRRDDVDDGHAALVEQLRRAARPAGRLQPAGESLGQVGRQQQAGDQAAEFSPGGEVEDRIVSMHENLFVQVGCNVARGWWSPLLSRSGQRLIRLQICRLRRSSQLSGSWRKADGAERLRW